MAGPTPVSSLLHSSTMVTAGIYLLMRLSPLIELSSFALILIIWLGSLSALLGAACGIVENDMKKIIAYSTSSQLGYMVVACGISQYNLALFHLICHAFFKSLLFLAAGAFIHSVLDNQDIRRMGSLNILTPITYSVFLLGSLSLMAAPFFSGFYSKDLLLEILLCPLNLTHSFAYLFTLFAALFTTIYSIRLLIYAMLSLPQFPRTILSYVTDSSSLMTIPLLILSTAALILGYLTNQIFLDPSFYGQSLYTAPAHFLLFDPLFAHSLLPFIPLSFLFFFLLLFPFSRSSHTSLSSTSLTTPLLSPSTNSWRYSHIFDPSLAAHFNIFNHWIMFQYCNLSILLYRIIDKGSLELFGPVGLSRLIHSFGFYSDSLSTGYLPHLAFLIIYSILFTLLLFI